IGQYYAGARNYAPSTGRWTTQDPLSFAAGDANLYRYVGNDSPNLVDPLGLAAMAEPVGPSVTVDGSSSSGAPDTPWFPKLGAGLVNLGQTAQGILQGNINPDFIAGLGVIDAGINWLDQTTTNPNSIMVSQNPIGPATGLSGAIPGYGSFRNMIDAMQHGRW